jgi:hypothetical protein
MANLKLLAAAAAAAAGICYRRRRRRNQTHIRLIPYLPTKEKSDSRHQNAPQRAYNPEKNTAIYSNALQKEKNTLRKRRCNRSSVNEDEDSGEEEEDEEALSGTQQQQTPDP